MGLDALSKRGVRLRRLEAVKNETGAPSLSLAIINVVRSVRSMCWGDLTFIYSTEIRRGQSDCLGIMTRCSAVPVMYYTFQAVSRRFLRRFDYKFATHAVQLNRIPTNEPSQVRLPLCWQVLLH